MKDSEVVATANIRLKQWWYHKHFYNDIILEFSTIIFCSTVLFFHFLKSLLIRIFSCQPHSIHLFPSRFSPALSNSHVSVHAFFLPYLVCENTGFSTSNQKCTKNLTHWKNHGLLVNFYTPFLLYYVAGTSGTILYNTAGLCYQLFLKCHHRINKYICNFLYLFLASNSRDKLSTSKHRYKWV